MENNRFFKYVWRANAVFLFVAGILLVGILLMTAVFMISDFTRYDTPPPIASTDAQSRQGEESFHLQAPSRQYGQESSKGFVYFELRSGTDSYGKFSSGESSQFRNIAVFDLNVDKTHWVFPDAQQEIEGFRAMKKTLVGEGEKNKTVTTGFILSVAKSLPDGTIARDLWSMTPDGKTLNKLLSDISKSPDIETYGDNKVKLIIESDLDFDIYPFDIDKLTIGEPTRISIP